MSDNPNCEVCDDLGFVRDAQDNVHPCPVCNEDGIEETDETKMAE